MGGATLPPHSKNPGAAHDVISDRPILEITSRLVVIVIDHCLLWDTRVQRVLFTVDSGITVLIHDHCSWHSCSLFTLLSTLWHWSTGCVHSSVNKPREWVTTR